MIARSRLSVLCCAGALAAVGCAAPARPPDRLAPYVDDLAQRGREPLEFVLDALVHHDLILFDDGLHSAVEPFDFYRRLVTEPAFRARVRYLFLETIPRNQQPHLDAYLASESGDPALLYPAFQNDTSGLGLAYRTYFDLLAAVREANLAAPPEQRLEVVAVSNPTYWQEIVRPIDVQLFRESLAGRDYDMYRIILAKLDDFESGRKGIFLTNTRHAYTGIRDARGELHWNTGTFFRQHHPGKTFSIRIHNVALLLEAYRESDPSEPTTTEGLERVRYRWGRVGAGIWDSAFAARGDRPAAISLASGPFGREPYAGNHMLDAAPGQTIADAYDGLIFLAPIEALHQSSTIGDLYTDEFRRELARRYPLMFTGEQIGEQLAEHGAANLDDLIDALVVAEPERPVPSVGPIDEWRRTAPPTGDRP